MNGTKRQRSELAIRIKEFSDDRLEDLLDEIKQEEKRRLCLSNVGRDRGDEEAIKRRWFQQAAKQIVHGSSSIEKQDLLDSATPEILACRLLVKELRRCLPAPNDTDEEPDIRCFFGKDCEFGDAGVIPDRVDGFAPRVSNLRFTPADEAPVFLCDFCDRDENLRKVANKRMDWSTLLEEFRSFLSNKR